MIHHGPDWVDGDVGALGEPHVHQKYRQTVGTLFRLLLRRRPHQQKHQIRMFRARGPDLLAVDDVMIIALPPGRSTQRQRVGARCGLGHAERLQAEFAAGDQWQIALFLSLAAVAQNCAHGVHLRVTGSAVAAGSVHLLQNCGSGAEIESTAAVFLRNQRCEIARPRKRCDEFSRVRAVAIQGAPVFTWKLRA